MIARAPKLFSLLSLALLCGGHATAQVVNIDFNVAGVGTTYSGQGAFADPGRNFWNGVTSLSGGSNFTASDGTTSTGISVSLSNVMGSYELSQYGQPASFAGGLFNDYFYRQSNTVASFTISGLTAGQPYQFYFYSQAGGSGVTNHGTIFTLDGNSLTATGNNASSFVSGTNFVMFAVTPSGTSLSGGFQQSGTSIEADFNGLQIAAVPEPSTSAAIGGAIALAGAFIFRRRHRQCV